MFPTKTITDFLKDKGYNQQLNEALSLYLFDKGFKGQLNEMLYDYLGSLGYLGTLPEKIEQWLEDGLADGGGVPSISDFYGTGPGQIGIHLSTDGATVDGSGNLTGIANQGGAGAVFDALVSGTVTIAPGGVALAMPGGAGYPYLANSADIVGVTLMWAAQETTTASIGVFGGSTTRVAHTSTGAFEIRDGSVVYAGGLARNTAWHVYELHFGPTEVFAVVDGTAYSPVAHSFATFLVHRIGRRDSLTANPFVGLMGDVLGVIDGGSAATAILTARQYLATRFGVTLA